MFIEMETRVFDRSNERISWLSENSCDVLILGGKQCEHLLRSDLKY